MIVPLTQEDFEIFQRVGHTQKQRAKFQRMLTIASMQDTVHARAELAAATNPKRRTVRPEMRARWRIRTVHNLGIELIFTAIY